jgi:hypothetical protein
MQYFVFHTLSLKTKCLVISHSPPKGFRSWKRVNDGVRYVFLMHMRSPTSPHNNAVKSAKDLMKVNRHINKVLNAQTVEEVQKNRLRLTTIIENV